MPFKIFNPFKNYAKEPKYSHDSLKDLVNPATKKEAGRYQDFVAKRGETNNKVESIFGNKGRFLKHQDLLMEAKKDSHDFKFHSIEHPGYYKSQEGARQGALNKLQERLKGATYYQKNKVEQALAEMKKDTTNPYLPGGQKARKALQEQVEFLEKFYGLSSH